jgi:hypothetical protein
MDWSSVLVSGLVGGVAGGVAGFLGHAFKAGKNVTVALVTVAVVGSGAGWRAYQQRRPVDYDGMVAELVAREPTTGMERYLRHWALATQAHPEIRQWFEATPGMKGEERQQASMMKTRTGLSRLSDEDLVQRMEILARMVEGAEVKDCAAFGRGDIQEEGLGRMFNGMDEESVRQFSAIVAKSMAADLRQDPPRKPLQADVTQVFGQVGAELGTLEAQRLANNLQRMGSLTDDEACWTTRTLYTQGIGLRDRHKSALALALTAG